MSGASTLAKLPDLSYDYGELEPYISAEIMQLHHSKHHQTYVTNYNVAAEQMDSAIAKNDFAKQIALQGAIRFNGGGHVNHTMFWQNLAPNGKGGGGEPVGSLRTAIDSQFQTFDAFKKTFSASTAAVQGSGWGWLVYDANVGGIRVMTTPNQDPVSMHGVVPLLGIDVWEHGMKMHYVSHVLTVCSLLSPVQERQTRLPRSHLERCQLD